jgi:hypothetical protein
VSDADDVLRAAVAGLGETYDWAGIAFVEQDELVLGPATGPAPGQTFAVPILYEGALVAELRVAPPEVSPEQRAALERHAEALAPVLPRRLGHGRRGVGSLRHDSCLARMQAVCRCFPPAPVAATGAYRFT